MSDFENTRLNLLLFSVGGVHFAVDADQVTGVADYDGEQAVDLFWFHEELAYNATIDQYASPMVFTIRVETGEPYRVIIDALEDVATFSLSDLRLFPPLLEPFVMQGGLWGILPRNGIMVLLVDFQGLLRYKRHGIEFNGGTGTC